MNLRQLALKGLKFLVNNPETISKMAEMAIEGIRSSEEKKQAQPDPWAVEQILISNRLSGNKEGETFLNDAEVIELRDYLNIRKSTG